MNFGSKICMNPEWSSLMMLSSWSFDSYQCTAYCLSFQVFGVGVPNPYRLRPFLGARVPLNFSFSSLINMHNPYSLPLQVSSFMNFVLSLMRANVVCFSPKSLMICHCLALQFSWQSDSSFNYGCNSHQYSDNFFLTLHFSVISYTKAN